jgi:phosphatidate cytidylyltransferase
MGTAAIGVTIWGGWPNAIFWSLVATAVAWEWQRIVGGEGSQTLAIVGSLTVALGMAASLLPLGWLGTAALVVLAGATAGVLAPRRLGPASALGLVYAYALGISAVLCRGQGWDGAVVILWLFAAVWGTDIIAYFTGRSLGGPKLWPAVSPKKTWSGAIGGLVGGAALGCMLLAAFGVGLRWHHVALSIAFSVLTQAGDLYESALKRRFGVKDSGSLIPGHGGFMDRLDGFVFAVVFAALVGGARAGWSAVPSGLLIWP